MKLTEKILNDIIAQVLNERSYSMDDMFKGTVSGQSSSSTYNTLRRITDPEEELTDDDFEYLKKSYSDQTQNYYGNQGAS